MNAPLDETFSADWLTLREPVDHAARNPTVMNACLDHLAHVRNLSPSAPLHILDMGCGTGSTVRGLAPLIAGRFPDGTQHWTLLDRDPHLLERAAETLASLQGNGVRVETRQADLADLASLDAILGDGAPTLVTGSALIDLVSRSWVDAMAAMAARHATAVLFALNYGGEEHWTPPHPQDRSVLAAFNADQRRDKGFGTALGPDATSYLADRFAAQDFAVTTGPSDWHVDGDRHRPLMTMLAEGIADAAARTMAPDDVQSWRAARRQADRAVISHADVFAAPPA